MSALNRKRLVSVGLAALAVVGLGLGGTGTAEAKTGATGGAGTSAATAARTAAAVATAGTVAAVAPRVTTVSPITIVSRATRTPVWRVVVSGTASGHPFRRVALLALVRGTVGYQGFAGFGCGWSTYVASTAGSRIQ
jgi:hypothetical protein